MGRIVDFDAATGKEIWRFHTIPTGTEPGAETWKDPESAKSGGGGTWTTFALDAASGELFVPIGNPAADFAGSTRPGDNLFTDSVVALDARSGAVNWYFQLVANDTLDYDLGAAPMLYTDGDGRERVAVGGKDGHLYSLDRRTHATLFKAPVTTILNPDAKPTPEGVFACPGPLGGVEWNGPAFDPASHTIYVGTDDWCATFKRGEAHKENSPFGAGQFFLGGLYAMDKTDKQKGWVVALDGTTGKARWRYQAKSAVVAGVTPTASGLVFSGTLGGDFFALDAKDGKLLHKISFNSPLAGGVVTYAVEGKQYVAATTGNISRMIWLTTGTPKVVIMTTGLPAGYALKKTSAAVPGEHLTKVAEAGSAHARQLFTQYCAACHGTRGEGGSGPPLIGENLKKTQAEAVEWIKNPQPPMPKLYPAPLSDTDVDELATMVRNFKF
jgi:alcohol dehydrogenase (cytochrome c)